jgi:hypothetical protein
MHFIGAVKRRKPPKKTEDQRHPDLVAIREVQQLILRDLVESARPRSRPWPLRQPAGRVLGGRSGGRAITQLFLETDWKSLAADGSFDELSANYRALIEQHPELQALPLELHLKIQQAVRAPRPGPGAPQKLAQRRAIQQLLAEGVPRAEIARRLKLRSERVRVRARRLQSPSAS